MKENEVASGPNMPDSFASFDPATSSWRTSQLSLFGGLVEFSETWPRAGMTRSGIAYPLPPLAPLTVVTGSGLWLTPTTEDHKSDGPKALQEWADAAAENRPVRQSAQRLRNQVLAGYDPATRAFPVAGAGTATPSIEPSACTRTSGAPTRETWPTPCANDAKNVPYQKGPNGQRYPMLLGAVAPERMWPTPTTQDASNNGGASQYSRNSLPLNAAAGGALNPRWVEWLMGYPDGWTDLEDSGTP